LRESAWRSSETQQSEYNSSFPKLCHSITPIEIVRFRRHGNHVEIYADVWKQTMTRPERTPASAIPTVQDAKMPKMFHPREEIRLILPVINGDDDHLDRFAILADDVPAGTKTGVRENGVDAGDGLRVGRGVVFASIFLRDGVEAVEFDGFKWIIGARLPDAVTNTQEVADVS
jgi:hypothetical protein